MTSDAMTAGAPALSCAGIRASYGPVQVLFDAGLTVEQGEMVALLGPNGVGKSTLLKVIGRAAASRRRHRPPRRRRRHHLATRKRVGLRAVPGRRPGHLPVAERDREPRDARLQLRQTGSGPRRPSRLPSRSSRGCTRAATSPPRPSPAVSGRCSRWPRRSWSSPKVLVIDEFSLGLAPVVVGGLMDLVRRLNERGHRRPARRAVGQRRALARRPRLHDGEGRDHRRGDGAAALAADPERVRALMLGGHARAVARHERRSTSGSTVWSSALFTGLTYGLLAVGLVLVYRSSRFMNFAHGSPSAPSAPRCSALFVVDWGLPYWVAFLVAILVGGLLSGLIEVGFVRRLEGRPSLVGMIATLGLSQLILVHVAC